MLPCATYMLCYITYITTKVYIKDVLITRIVLSLTYCHLIVALKVTFANQLSHYIVMSRDNQSMQTIQSWTQSTHILSVKRNLNYCLLLMQKKIALHQWPHKILSTEMFWQLTTIDWHKGNNIARLAQFTIIPLFQVLKIFHFQPVDFPIRPTTIYGLNSPPQ